MISSKQPYAHSCKKNTVNRFTVSTLSTRDRVVLQAKKAKSTQISTWVFMKKMHCIHQILLIMTLHFLYNDYCMYSEINSKTAQ